MFGCVTGDLITKIDSRKNDAISTLRIHETCHSTKSLFIVTKSMLKMNRKEEEICWLVVSRVSDLSRSTLLCLSVSILRQNSMVGLRGWSQVPYFTADRRQKDWEEGASDRYALLRPSSDQLRPTRHYFLLSVTSTRTLKLWSHRWTHSLMRSESSMSSLLSGTGSTTTCDWTFCTGANGGISNPNQHWL